MTNIGKLVQALEEGPRCFMDLKRLTGVENGVIQHHIRNSDRLVKEKHAIMLSGYCDDCKLKDYCQERCIEAVLEDGFKTNMLELFIKGFSQREIADKLGISPATVNHHLSRMRRLNIIKDGRVRSDVKKRL